MQTVGEMLRSERERKGLTLKNVEADTNIRALYLQAIEDGNYSVLPGETYVKGFIRNYANSLGLNGTEYVEIYRKSQQVYTDSAASSEPSPAKPAALPQKDQSKDQSQTSSSSYSRWIGLAVMFMLAAGGIWWVTAGTSKPQTPENPPQQVQQPKPQAVPQPPTQQTPKAPVANGVSLVAKFIDRSWIQVTADEKQVYEGIPQPGESMTWQANQKITIKVGNAGAVELTHNGQPIGKLGGNGEVVLKTFTVQ